MEKDKLMEAVNLSVEILHADSRDAGWWTNDQPSKEAVCTKLLLIVSEITEAMEGLRKDLQDDKLPEYKMFDVELADTFIRLCDLAGKMNVNLGLMVVEKRDFNKIRPDHKLENRKAAGGKAF